MKVKTSEMVSRVFALLNENEMISEERVEYGDPGAMLRPLILDLLPDAARAVIKEAPLSKINDCTHVSDLDLTPEINQAGNTVMHTAQLPANFLRLLYARASDWPTGLTTPMEYGGDAYRLRVETEGRGNRGFRALRRPALAIRHTGQQATIEVFGSMPGARLESLDYAAQPEISGKHIDIPPALKLDICAKTAEMVAAVLNG